MSQDEVHLMEQNRREMAEEFLIRTKGHLDRLAQAGIDTRIVRELVALHKLAGLACGMRASSCDMMQEIMQEINCAAYFERLNLPATANEAVLLANRAARGGDTPEALYQNGYVDAVDDTVKVVLALRASAD